MQTVESVVTTDRPIADCITAKLPFDVTDERGVKVGRILTVAWREDRLVATVRLEGEAGALALHGARGISIGAKVGQDGGTTVQFVRVPAAAK